MSVLNEDTFIDILEERRRTKDLSWSLKKWEVPPCRYSRNRTPQEIKQQVLSSEVMQGVIDEATKQRGCSRVAVERDARKIVDEMSHNLNFRVIRFFAYTLSKFMKSVYGKILVNKKGVEKIANLSTQYPMLYLPTHRSYSDFLLVSYVCFYFNLPVPVIAAGMDFLGLKFLSFLLRGAGAFFIRRSLGDDFLYRNIFFLYVQTHIEGCEFPMEFFIEGTRSRSAKSLVPKLGMLQYVLEMYFSSKIPDLTVVPISISYDRTLEETLYAYEMLGVPKPKESTTGLIKARKVMSDFYGNVYVRFGEPISVREFFKDYNRSSRNLHPRDSSVPEDGNFDMANQLANYVVRMHQCNLLLSPFPLICLVLGNPDYRKGFNFNSLVDHVSWLEELVRRSGATIHIDCDSLAKDMTEQLRLHSNIVHLSDDLNVTLKDINVPFRQVDAPIPQLGFITLMAAVPVMYAHHYGCQALQLLSHVSMVCLAYRCLQTPECKQQDQVFHLYKILRHLLQREFVFEKDTTEKDFMHAVQSLKEENILSVDNSELVASSNEKVKFLADLLYPFIQTYLMVCKFITKLGGEQTPSRLQLIIECQSFIEHALRHNTLHDCRCLSLEIITNCIMFLVNQTALMVNPKSERTSSYYTRVSNVIQQLELFLPGESSQPTQSTSRLPAHSAKL